MNGEVCATRNTRTLRWLSLLFEALFPPTDIDRDAFRNVYRLRLQMCTDGEMALSHRESVPVLNSMKPVQLFSRTCVQTGGQSDCVTGMLLVTSQMCEVCKVRTLLLPCDRTSN